MDLVDAVVGSFANSAMDDMLRSVATIVVQGLTVMMSIVGTWWLEIPPPVLETADGGAPAQRITQALQAFVGIVGLLSFVIVIPKVAMSMRQEPVLDMVWGFLRVILVSAIGLATITLLLEAGDEVSPWILETISGGTFEDGIGQMTDIAGTAVSLAVIGQLSLLILMIPLVAIGGLVNMIFVFFSYGMIVVVGGLLPVLAADTFSESGKRRFDKVMGWILALVLFKPVAAIIYGTGFAMMRGINGAVPAADEATQAIVQMIFGIVIVGAATIALPALLRIAVPAVAAGSRGIGAGQAVMAGAMLATGAATLGASAAAKGAATAGRSASGSGMAKAGNAASGTSESPAAANTATSGGQSAASTGSAGGTSGAGGSAPANGGTGGQQTGTASPSGQGTSAEDTPSSSSAGSPSRGSAIGSSGGSSSGSSGGSSNGSSRTSAASSSGGSSSGSSNGSSSGSSGSSGAKPAPSTTGGQQPGQQGPGGAGSGQPERVPQVAQQGTPAASGSGGSPTGAGSGSGSKSAQDRSRERMRAAGQHLRQQVTGAGESIDAGDDK